MSTPAPRRCALAECGALFVGQRSRRKYCTPACRDRAKAGPRAERRIACARCGTIVVARGQRATVTRYCSPECAAEATRERERKTPAPCATCAAPCPPGRPRYCSPECAESAKAERQRAARIARQPILVCALSGCEETFRKDHPARAYCTDEHSAQARIDRQLATNEADKVRRIEERARLAGEPLSATCRKCGAAFVWHRGDRRGRERRLCDECRIEWDYPFKPERDPNRPNRLAVLDRDGWRCALCGFPIPGDENFDWGSGADLTLRGSMDHVRPRIAGGEDTWRNVQAAHHGCNSAKGDRWDGVSGYGPELEAKESR